MYATIILNIYLKKLRDLESDFRSYRGKFKTKAIVILVVGLTFLSFSYYYLISPMLVVLSKSKTLPKKIRDVKTALISQDYTFASFEIDYLKEDLVAIEDASKKMSVFSVVPFLGNYFRDLKNISSSSIDMFDIVTELLASMEDIAPNLRFKGWGVIGETTLDSAASANVASISAILAKELPEYKKRFFLINKRLEKIDPNMYPKNFRGFEVRANLYEIKSISSMIVTSFQDIVNLVEIIPELVGETESKNYLVLFEDNNWLRPSGGVLNAYAVFNVKSGKVKISKSGDIVILDNASGSIVTAPDFVRNYMGVDKFYLRDAAHSPDFRVSAETIRDLWAEIFVDYTLHGVIVLDNHLITSLFQKVTGSNATDLDEVTRKLDSFSESVGRTDSTNKENKGEIAAFLYGMIEKSFATSMQKRVDLFRTFYSEAKEKHIVAYFPANSNFQKLIEEHNFGGVVKTKDADYLLVSNFNIDGAVSNRYVTQAIHKTIDVKEGEIFSTITLEYDINTPTTKTYKDFLRIYVPNGSKLISTEGFGSEVMLENDLNKTIFSGYFEVTTDSKKTLKIVYELPLHVISENTYKLFVQKQIGQEAVKLSVDIKDQNKSTVLNLNEDTEIKLQL